MNQKEKLQETLIKLIEQETMEFEHKSLNDYVTNNMVDKRKLNVLHTLDKYRLTDEEMEYCLNVEDTIQGSIIRDLCNLMLLNRIDVNKAKELYNGNKFIYKYVALFLLSHNINDQIIKNVLNSKINFRRWALDKVIKQYDKHPISDEQLNFLLTELPEDNIIHYYEFFTKGLDLDMARFINKFKFPFNLTYLGVEYIALTAAVSLNKNDAKFFIEKILSKYFDGDKRGNVYSTDSILQAIINKEVSLKDVYEKSLHHDNISNLMDELNIKE